MPVRLGSARSFALLRMTLPSIILHNFYILQSLFNLYFFVSFNNITDLDIVAVCQTDTTFKVCTYFFHIILGNVSMH